MAHHFGELSLYTPIVQLQQLRRVFAIGEGPTVQVSERLLLAAPSRAIWHGFAANTARAAAQAFASSSLGDIAHLFNA